MVQIAISYITKTIVITQILQNNKNFNYQSEKYLG